MKLLIEIIVMAVLLAALLPACKSTQKPARDTQQDSPAGYAAASAPVIIYKTHRDHFNHVPVILNPEKSRIVSYPAPADLYHRGELAKPQKMQEGFLLDRRGVDENAAFLSLTYEEYASLKNTPAADSLFELIIDRDPFSIIYHCGHRKDFEKLEDQLNIMISSGVMEKCRRLDK